MGKKNKRGDNKKPSKKEEKKLQKQMKSASSLLEEVEAMSSDEGSVEKNNKAWNAQAEALEKLIKGGAYDKIASQENKGSDDSNEEEDDESIEEVVLGNEDDGSNDEDDEDTRKGKNNKHTKFTTSSSDRNSKKKSAELNSREDEDEDSSDDEKAEKVQTEHDVDVKKEGESENDDDDGDDDESGDEGQQSIFDLNSKALLTKTEELLAEKKNFPWVEKFEVVPSAPLPFGNTDEETGIKIDVHDDLKREVAFYDLAMEAVEMAKIKCKEGSVPFTRPDDFFAEMVKSDDHMARVKDRLIFENKKIEAVAQRKSNREQKLRSKEAHANKIAEKSRRRKENIKAVDEWAKGAAANRGGRYGDNDDQKFLTNLSSSGQKRPWTDRDGNMQTGPNKKRMAANKKYGYGGKRGRFKQNDLKSMNDMSGFNPRGNFGGVGTKKTGGGSGANRKGKRARDASRSRQRS